MIVMKFGGTSVGDAARIKSVADIVSKFKDRNPIVVLSAVGGVTDKLIEAAENSINSGTVNMDEIAQKHKAILKELELDNSLIDNELGELKDALEIIAKGKEKSTKIIDLASSFGERMSTRIVAAYFNSIGIEAKNFDAYDIGMITDSNFGSAGPLPQAYEKLKESLSDNDFIPVVTGFIGKDEKGIITTLGRGGSDYTAAIIGAALEAEEIQIWTDVNGIMTSDPRIVKEAKTIPQISFNEAAELATFGARVLHPKTILPAVEKNIPVRVLDSFNPSSKGTSILSEFESSSEPVKAIALKKNITLFNITSTRMLLAHGFLSHLFKVFNDNQISVDMIATSEVSVSLTVDSNNGNGKLEKAAGELKEIGDVTIEEDKSLVCLVGNGMKSTVGFSARVFGAIGKNNINIEAISQGASEINVAFIVGGKDGEKAVQCLHKEFFN